MSAAQPPRGTDDGASPRIGQIGLAAVRVSTGGGRVSATGRAAPAADMKTSKEIRWDNFQLALRAFKEKRMSEFPDEPERGMLRRFAERVTNGGYSGFSERYASHLNARRKPIGTHVARSLEAALGLPSGWMDHAHGNLSAEALGTVTEPAVRVDGSVQPPALRAYLEMAEAVFRALPEEAQATVMSLATKALKGTHGGRAQ